MHNKGVPQLRIGSSILLRPPHCHAAVYADEIIVPLLQVEPEYYKTKYGSTLKEIQLAVDI